MASSGSVSTSSPETKTSASTPPRDSPDGFKMLFNTPPSFRLSPSEPTAGLCRWEQQEVSQRSHPAQMSHWEQEAERPLSSYNTSVPATQGIFMGPSPFNSDGHASPHPLDHLPRPSLFSSRQESSVTSLLSRTQWSSVPTRHLVIHLPQGIEVSVLEEFLKEIGDLKGFTSRKMGFEDVCAVSFFDIRKAITAHKRLQLEQFCGVRYCPQSAIGTWLGQMPYLHEGKVLCEVIINSPIVNSSINSCLYTLLADYGSISSFKVLEEEPSLIFVASYYDLREAEYVVAQLDGQYVESFYVRLFLYDRPLENHSPSSTYQRVSSDGDDSEYSFGFHRPNIIHAPRPLRHPYDMMARAESNASLHYSPGYSPVHSPVDRNFDQALDHLTRDTCSLFVHSPAAPSLPLTKRPQAARIGLDVSRLQRWGHDMDEYHEMLSSRPHDPRRFRSKCNGVHDQLSSRRLDVYHPGINKNTLDLDRIRKGLDTRTTVMLRNIPNKVDRETLKEFIDSTSARKYNFLYLRIDFKNMCNVGYAFINFIDPIWIIPFVEAKAGKRWNKYNSDKVLDVTYANIQGIDQLVEKFRNSGVMEQPEAYRPKLYYSDGEKIGQEMEFPASNNPNRKLRSITAAQHIGLFAPKIQPNARIWRKRD